MERWWKAKHGGAHWASLTAEDRCDLEDFTGCVPGLLALVSKTQLPLESGSDTSAAPNVPGSSIAVNEEAETLKKSATLLKYLKSRIRESEMALQWKNMLDSHVYATYGDKKDSPDEER